MQAYIILYYQHLFQCALGYAATGVTEDRSINITQSYLQNTLQIYAKLETIN